MKNKPPNHKSSTDRTVTEELDMSQEKANNQEVEEKQKTDEEGIEEALSQMDLLVKSRCVQSPFGKNVVVREIEKDT